MNLSHVYNFLVFTIISIGLYSCSPIISTTFHGKISKKDKTIPPDYGNSSKEVLIIGLVGYESYDKKIKDMVTKYYKGRTAFVIYTDLNSKEYSNTEKYRYRFSVSSGIERTVTQVGNSINHGHIDTYTPEIRDLKTDVVYKNPKPAYRLKKVVKAYMKELEKERLKGSGGIQYQ